MAAVGWSRIAPQPRLATQDMYHPVMKRMVAAFILAGGKSTRMGSDKAFVNLDGRTLLARAIDSIGGVTSDVHIVGDFEKFSPFAPVIEDKFPGCGPLAGIHAALSSSGSDLNLILAVDLPFVSAALLEFLISLAENSSAIVTVPRVGERLQPLCAVYRRPFATLAEAALRAGEYKIDPLFSKTETLIVEEAELQAAGFSPRCVHNVNTPAELSDASR